MKIKDINIRPSLVASLIFSFFLFTNLLLFVLRTRNLDWWSGDNEIYNSVDFETHLFSILYFVFYICLYVLILKLFFSKNTKNINLVNLNKLFWFILFLFSLQIYFALSFDVGIAGAANKTTSPIQYSVLLFSFEGIYYAYALKEKSTSRLLWASLFYAVSNIIRGWAGFVVFLIIIYFIRQRKIDKKKFLLFTFVFFVSIPILLVVRDFFRGGYSNFDYLADTGIIGVDLYYQYFIDSLKFILVRFDFYSNYIGVNKMGSHAINASGCFPLQENILYKSFALFNWVDNCVSLGSILPSYLYSFFIDKGTSFAIGSGFFGLPAVDALIYLYSYLFVLISSSFLVRFLMVENGYRNFFVLLVFLLLLQGWMYQFLHNFLGFIIGWVLSNRKTFSSESIINQNHKL